MVLSTRAVTFFFFYPVVFDCSGERFHAFWTTIFRKFLFFDSTCLVMFKLNEISYLDIIVQLNIRSKMCVRLVSSRILVSTLSSSYLCIYFFFFSYSVWIPGLLLFTERVLYKRDRFLSSDMVCSESRGTFGVCDHVLTRPDECAAKVGL